MHGTNIYMKAEAFAFDVMGYVFGKAVLIFALTEFDFMNYKN